MLKKYNKKIKVMAYLSYRDYLSAVYAAAKSSEKTFSYVKFSDALGLTKTNVAWMIITGRRALTPSTVKKVVKSLGLVGKERLYFVAMVEYCNARQPQKRELYLRKLTTLKKGFLESSDEKEQLEYFSEWYHPVIREMTNLDEFKSDPSWISKKLFNKLMPKQAKDSLDLLEKLELIQFDEEDGRHRPKGESIRPGRSVRTIAAIRYHQKMLEMARESLTRVPKVRREINTLTLCIGQGDLDKIREILRDACRDALDIEEKSQDSLEVYQLNMQLFPFTKESTDSGDTDEETK